ncbi:MAG: endo-1,4-beta-xylanase [Roseburia sp.]|nr:endo-1,4-beta-xylanase [Roseburia sp.]
MNRYWKKVLAGFMSGLLICGGVGMGMTLTANAEKWEIIETDIPNWKDSVTGALGEDAIAGGAVTQSELKDQGVFELLTKHCNAVTFGNELKPDCLFDYSNDRCPGTEEIIFNGKSLLVPKPKFDRADSMLKRIKEWNDENPDNQLKVRGHVLVWHSQTPEWFFHEDYDKTKDYVDKDTMNLRLEWYIKTVLEHYFGEDSPYKDMFYGWDVVNEAVSDSNGVYRTDTENGNDKLSDSTHGSKSSWWHVYGSNEYIINAFVYANKYAPAQLKLYYNDYGDISVTKKEGIKELLTAVKEAEGAPGVGTRIDGFGMQGHYDRNSFSITDFEQAAREYGEIVDSVQLTELDFKAGSSYDGTEATREAEYVAQARNYQAIFETCQKLVQEGIQVDGITFWGTVDKYSWLQSRSDVGGGADGVRTQCPLMFDDDYKAKPAFWAFVNPEKIAVFAQQISIPRTTDGSFARQPEYSFAQEEVEVTFVPLWDEEGLKLKLTITDRQIDDNDSVTVYVDEENARKDGVIPVSVTVTREEASPSGGGYKTELAVPLQNMAPGKVIGFDIAVVNGDKRVSFNDFRGNQDNSSAGYAEASLKPEIVGLPQGKVTVDGERDNIWDTAVKLPLEINSGARAQAEVRLLWDIDYLYVYAEITDSEINVSAAKPEEQDCLEICIDEKNEKAGGYDQNDKLYRINAEGAITFAGQKATDENVRAVTRKTEGGYVIEACVKWTEFTPKVHHQMGLELRVKDADAEGKLSGVLGWADGTDAVTENPAKFGTARLAVAAEASDAGQTEPEASGGADSAPEKGDEAGSGTETSGGLSGAGGAAIAILAVLAAAIGAGLVLKKKKDK